MVIIKLKRCILAIPEPELVRMISSFPGAYQEAILAGKNVLRYEQSMKRKTKQTEQQLKPV